MPVPFTWLTQQATSTTGTGTLVLSAASSDRRSFATAFGAAMPIAYRMRVPGTSLYEVGIGQFDGANPGGLTRATVLSSSNAGALVSFTGVADVIPVMLPGQRQVVGVTSGATEVVADLGCVILFTGTSAATRTLPAVASVPRGAGYLYINESTNGSWLILDGNGSETVGGLTTLTLFPGESCEIFAGASGWTATGLPPESRVRSQTASASAQIDFVLPTGFSDFRVEMSAVRPATDGAILSLRTSTDSGATFAAGAADYYYVSEATLPNTSAVTATNANASAIVLTSQIDTATAAQVTTAQIRFHVGNGTQRATFQGEAYHLHNGLGAGSMHRVGAERLNGTAINAVRFLMDSGNITAGRFDLIVRR